MVQGHSRGVQIRESVISFITWRGRGVEGFGLPSTEYNQHGVGVIAA